MSLPAQVIPIPFTSGLNTKPDPFQIPIGQLSALSNGVFTNPGKIGLRNGVQGLSTIISSGGNITTGQALMSFNNELLVADVSDLYSWATSSSDWVEKGPLTSVYTTQNPIIRNTYQQVGQDGTVSASGAECYAWEDSSGGVRYSIIDGNTGQLVVNNTLLSATGIKPKCLSIGNLMIVMYVDTGSWQIFSVVIPVQTPALPNVAVAITPLGSAGLSSTQPNYDACVIGSQFYVAFQTGITGDVTVNAYTAISPVASVYSVTASSVTNTCLTIFGDLVSNGPVLITVDGTTLTLNAYSDTLSSIASGTETLGSSISSISGVSTSAVTRNLQVFVTTTPSVGVYTFAFQGSGYTIGDNILIALGIGIAGKAFNYQGTAYIPTAYTSPLQNTYFIIDENASIVAKALPGTGGGIPVRTDGNGYIMLPEVSIASSTAISIPFLTQDFLTTFPASPTLPTSGAPFATPTTAVYTQTGVTSFTFDFNSPQNSYANAILGNNLQVGGGFITMYDGNVPVEQNFHLFPELTQNNFGLSPTGGHLGLSGLTAQYWYVATYEWTDSFGQIHRSAPSIPLSVTTANNNTTSSVQINIPTLRLTAKQDPQSPVTINVYRTIGNGSVFYWCMSSVVPLPYDPLGVTNHPIINDPTLQLVQFKDILSDADIQNEPYIYTTGGVVENTPANPSSTMAVYVNRIFALDSTNPLTIWMSQQVVPGQPVRFSEYLTYNVDPRGGPVTSIAYLADKLVIFKATQTFYMYGVNGPDQTGANSDFSPLVQAMPDVGCVNPRSMVSTPVGLMFQSLKGIWLLNPSLQGSYIGAPVEAFNGATVTSASLVPDSNQVRFTLDSGITLVYDMYQQQWSTFSPYNGVDSTIWQNNYAYLTPDGVVMVETPGVYSDNGAFIELSLTTAWLAFAQMQGFQRVRKIGVLGQYYSPNQINIGVAYNYNPAITQVDAFIPTPPGTWGSGALWGSDTTWGTNGVGAPVEQIRVFCDIQKCESIQVTLSVTGTDTTGQGVSLSALSFEVAGKTNIFRLPASQSVG